MQYGIKVYFNQGMFEPFKESEYPLTIEASSENEALNIAFARLNHDNRPNGKTERSLSVGDIITIGRPGEHTCQTYFVDRFGFEKMVH